MLRILSITLLLLITMACGSSMNINRYIRVNGSDFGKNPIIIRTDNSSNKIWRSACDKIINLGEIYGDYAYVDFVDDKKLYTLTIDELKVMLKQRKDYYSSFFFIADSLTMLNEENSFLCISLHDEYKKNFRVTANELFSIENSLSTANLSYDEFYILQDEDGVIRNWDVK